MKQRYLIQSGQIKMVREVVGMVVDAIVTDEMLFDANWVAQHIVKKLRLETVRYRESNILVFGREMGEMENLYPVLVALCINLENENPGLQTFVSKPDIYLLG
jgi:hypothetical protein